MDIFSSSSSESIVLTLILNAINFRIKQAYCCDSVEVKTISSLTPS